MAGDPANPLLALRDRLGGRRIVLDGGLATELEERGHDLADELWSARLLLDDPDAIRAVHAGDLDAGSDVVITASYQATIEGFQRRGATRADAILALRSSTDIAKQARQAFPDALVAASVGPYGAALADGSEYRPQNYDLNLDGLVAWHEERFDILARSGADMLACETLPCLTEAVALSMHLRRHPATWAWFSFTCRDDRSLQDGTPIEKCAELLDRFPRVAALGVNCTAPSKVAGLLRRMRSATSKPLLAYPNSGEHWDAASRRWTGIRSAAQFADQAAEWSEAGAIAIGGCCRTGPDYIRALRKSS